jgi:hypothetical protein
MIFRTTRFRRYTERGVGILVILKQPNKQKQQTYKIKTKTKTKTKQNKNKQTNKKQTKQLVTVGKENIHL